MAYIGRTSNPLGMLLPMLMLVMLAGMFGLIILGGGLAPSIATTTAQTTTRLNALNITQSRANYHVGAEQAWRNYREGVCENKQVYFKPERGFLMVSCQISGTDQCAQLIFQVTEHRLDTLIPMSPGMLIHGQIHPCTQVNGYLWKRDNYTTWEQITVDIRDVVTSAFGEP